MTPGHESEAVCLMAEMPVVIFLTNRAIKDMIYPEKYYFCEIKRKKE